MNERRKFFNDYLASKKNFDYQAIEKELNIPIKLKEAIDHDGYISFKHLIYTTYLLTNAPQELEEIKRELISVINELTKVRPGWQWAEDIWHKRADIHNEILQNNY